MTKFNPQKSVRAHFVRTRSFSPTCNEIRHPSNFIQCPISCFKRQTKRKVSLPLRSRNKTVLGSLHADQETTIAKRQKRF